MRRILMEICCGTASDAAAAASGGADRIELNSGLELGGLTPSVGSLTAAKSLAAVPVLAMIRPRAGDFRYDKADWQAARIDAKALIAAGADGLVFGFLNPDGTVDRARTRVLVELAGGRECVFHRAFDFTPDWREALEALISLGVRRVLSSGGQPDAERGAARLAEMVRFAGGDIEILPGGGIRPENVRKILRDTGCGQVHLSARKQRENPDPGNAMRLGAMDDGSAFAHTDPRTVAQMRAILDRTEAET